MLPDGRGQQKLEIHRSGGEEREPLGASPLRAEPPVSFLSLKNVSNPVGGDALVLQWPIRASGFPREIRISRHVVWRLKKKKKNERRKNGKRKGWAAIGSSLGPIQIHPCSRQPWHCPEILQRVSREPQEEAGTSITRRRALEKAPGPR